MSTTGERMMITVPNATCGSSNESVSEQEAAALSCTREMMKSNKKKAMYGLDMALMALAEQDKEREEREQFLNSLESRKVKDGILTICRPSTRGALEYGMDGGKKVSLASRKRKMNDDASETDSSGSDTSYPLVIDESV